MADIKTVLGVETYNNKNGDIVQNIHLSTPYCGGNDFEGVCVEKVYNGLGIPVHAGDKVKLYYRNEERWNSEFKKFLPTPVLDDIVIVEQVPFKSDNKDSKK